jgi:hypothetical protein
MQLQARHVFLLTLRNLGACMCRTCLSLLCPGVVGAAGWPAGQARENRVKRWEKFTFLLPSLSREEILIFRKVVRPAPAARRAQAGQMLSVDLSIRRHQRSVWPLPPRNPWKTRHFHASALGRWPLPNAAKGAEKNSWVADTPAVSRRERRGRRAAPLPRGPQKRMALPAERTAAAAAWGIGRQRRSGRWFLGPTPPCLTRPRNHP